VNEFDDPELGRLLGRYAGGAPDGAAAYDGIQRRIVRARRRRAAVWTASGTAAVVLGVAALTMGVAQIVGAASGGRDPLQPLEHLGGMAASATAATGAAAPAFQRVRSVSELDDVLARADRTVMLDFYADWCVSCKEMERFTFSRPEIAARMSRAILLKADVTENNAQDRELLRRFKLFGPPGTVFFGTGGREIAGTRVIGFLPAARFADVLKAAGL